MPTTTDATQAARTTATLRLTTIAGHGKTLLQATADANTMLATWQEYNPTLAPTLVDTHLERIAGAARPYTICFTFTWSDAQADADDALIRRYEYQAEHIGPLAAHEEDELGEAEARAFNRDIEAIAEIVRSAADYAEKAREKARKAAK